MPYNFAAEFSHKETLEPTFFKRSKILDGNRPFCIFETPCGGVLGGTYDDPLRLIGKRVIDFPLVLIELFSLGVTAEELRANIVWKSAILLQGAVDPKFQVEGVAPTHQSRLNGLSYDITILTDLSSIFSQITHLREGRPDGQTKFSSLDSVYKQNTEKFYAIELFQICF